MNKHPIDDEDKPEEFDEDAQDEEAKRMECSELFYAHIVFMFSSCYISCVLVNFYILSN